MKTKGFFLKISLLFPLAILLALIPLEVQSTEDLIYTDLKRVKVHDIIADPTQFHGQRVVLSGMVQSIKLMRGRMGSEFILILIEETGPVHYENRPTVKVVVYTNPMIKVGQAVAILGVYHREGRVRGLLYNSFIAGEEIRRERTL